MHISTLFIWFLLYSIIGWIYETVFCSIKKLKWDNRGMLIGPYCPIYGVGAVLDVLLCSRLPDAGSVFFACMLGSAVLEYATSYATERLFHAVWWDYSKLPFNLHGRICLSCSLGFGIAGWIVLYGIHPYLSRLTAPLPLELQELLSLLFMAVFAADCTLTADSLAQINVKLEATMRAIDAQIAEKYESFIENTKQNIAEGLDTLKGKISLEEYREHRTIEEVKKTLLTMNWVQTRVLRSSVSFRRVSYSDIGSRMKHALSFGKRSKRNKEKASEKKPNSEKDNA
ncbi:MAG: putative ABC transporter permease [Eubacterium sp.]|nr:putative ABC transporter permease [Eubacterium sp.]